MQLNIITKYKEKWFSFSLCLHYSV